MNFFDKLNTWMENIEGSFITFVTTLIPWLAPALPAYLTYMHLVEMIGVPVIVAGAMAATVEFLGLAAVSTAFQYMRHNKLNKAEKNKVSLAFPVGAYLFYLIVIVTVNVLSEVPFPDWAHVWVRVLTIALLTLISAPAFIVAVSRQQARDIEAQKVTGKTPAAGRKETESKRKVTDWRKVSEEDYPLIAKMETSAIMKAYGLDGRSGERTARNWRNNAKDELAKRRNGKVEVIA